MKLNKNLLVAVCLVLIALLGGYFLRQKHGEKNMTVALSEKISSLDPATAFDDYALTVTGQIYEPLYHYHYLKRPYEIIPLLAEDFPLFRNDGKTMRIKIKKGIRYHDHPAFKGESRYVKADDFLNQFKRLALKTLNSPGVWFFAEKLKGFKAYQETLGDNWENIFKYDLPSVEVVDEFTIDIHFIQKEVQSLHYLTMAFVVPIPEEVIRWHENDMNQMTVGTGPFFLDWFNESELMLRQYPLYREQRYPSAGDRFANTKNLLRDQSLKIPFLESVLVQIQTNGDQAINKFLNQEIDMMLVPTNYEDKVMPGASDITDKLQKIEAEVSYSPSLSVRWLSFNMRDPIWGKNIQLRRAIAHAIDLDEYTRDVIDRSKLVANSIYNPGIFGYRPSKTRPYQYSIEIAKKLLKEAGYPNGKGLPELHFYSRSDKPQQKVLADFLKEQLGQIGIKLVIHIQTFKEYLTKARSNNNPMQMWLDGWIYDYPDAENILQLLLSTNGAALNKTGFKNIKFDRLYNEYVSDFSQDNRQKLLYQMENIVDENCPWIMLSYENNAMMKQKRIQNLRWSNIIRDSFKYIDLE